MFSIHLRNSHLHLSTLKITPVLLRLGYCVFCYRLGSIALKSYSDAALETTMSGTSLDRESVIRMSSLPLPKEIPRRHRGLGSFSSVWPVAGLSSY